MLAKVLLLLILQCLIFMQTQPYSPPNTKVIISGQVILQGCYEVKACGFKPGNPLAKRDFLANYVKSGHWVSMKGRVILKGCFLVRSCNRHFNLGSKKNPATSCKIIKKYRRSAKSGVYYIKTNPTVSKVYCYMEDIPGCGGGGWTTIMKTDGNKNTFPWNSAFWKNKNTYHVTNGQSGVDNKETKLPTYWTLPFKSLCLGMKRSGQKKANWIRVDYKASSLYSVIADGQYRSFSIGRNKWKSLIAGSSLQTHCNREGFNSYPYKSGEHKNYRSVRIGIITNNENDCKTPDTFLGFGSQGGKSTGNGGKPAHGYILAQ